MGSEYGHVKISRKAYAEDAFWNEPRVFSRWEAWEDMIQMAAWKEHRKMVKASMVTVKRGELIASERFLSERWQWSRTKVRAFLSMLEDMERITRDVPKKDHTGARISLCNYALYQSVPSEKEPVKDQSRTSEEPVEDQREGSKAREAVKQENHLSGAAAPAEPDPAKIVFQHWQKASGHAKAKYTADRKRRIRARLGSYSADQLCLAIDRACANPWYRGENDRGQRYDWVETILKNDDAVDRHLAYKPRQNGNGHGTPQTYDYGKPTEGKVLWKR